MDLVVTLRGANDPPRGLSLRRRKGYVSHPEIRLSRGLPALVDRNKGLYQRYSSREPRKMKSIRYGEVSLVTSNSIAEQLVEYAVQVSKLGTSSAVTIPVLESNGLVVDHTLVINAGSQLSAVDVDGGDDGSEGERFNAPDFPPVGSRATAESPEDSAALVADDFGGIL